MAGELDSAFAKFKALPKAKLAELDDALAFVTTAQMPTQKGANNRAILAGHPIDPDSMKALAAYRAYKFKLEHAPLADKDKALMRLGRVPDDEIARLDSREKWEQDQLTHFNPLMDLINNTKPVGATEMSAESITAKAPRAKPRPAPAPASAAGPEGAPSSPMMSGPPMPTAPIAPGPLLDTSSPVMTIGGQPIAAGPKPPLAVALNGGY